VSGKSGQFGVFGNSRHGKHGSHVENGAPGFRTVQKTDIVPVNPASSGEYRVKVRMSAFAQSGQNRTERMCLSDHVSLV
jgi:hypothetical protein